MTEHLFSYGTIQNDKTQLILFGRLLEGTRDSLPGYKLASVEIRDPAFLGRGEEKFQRTIVKSGEEAECINGTVFKISEDELSKTDQYEPLEYKRTRVTLQSGKEAWIYTASAIK